MVRETEWKASCISFFAKWAYFTPSVSPQVLTAMRETFHKSLDSPCRSLKDLSVLLGLVYDQVNESIPDSELPEVVSGQQLCNQTLSVSLLSFHRSSPHG